MKLIYKSAFVVIAAVSLQSCVATKEYQKPEVWENASFNTNEVVSDSVSQYAMPWRSVVTDPALQQRIVTAFENNIDIRGALENSNQAQSYWAQGKAGYMPTLSIGTNYTQSVDCIYRQ